MNTIFRRNIDIEVALKSAARAASISRFDSPNEGRVVEVEPTGLKKRRFKLKLRKRIKRILRRMQIIVNATSRPVAALDSEIEHVRAGLTREMREGLAALRVDMIRSAVATSEEARVVPKDHAERSVTTRGVVVVGAGGHAKVVVELLKAMGEQVAYCVGLPDSNDRCLDVPVLKGDEHLRLLREKGFDRIFIAVGSNALRQEIAEKAIQLGFELVNAISPTSVISPSAKMGRGIAIMGHVVINADTVVGDLAIINTGATIDHDCRIGRSAHIAPRCGLAGNVEVGAGSFLGIGCSVIPGVSVGENSVVGAGSVVIRNVPAGITVVGNPASRALS